MFLKNLTYPSLRIGVPANISLKLTSSKSIKKFNEGSVKLFLISILISLFFFANLFQGQIAKQSSHPNILFPIGSLNFLSM